MGRERELTHLHQWLERVRQGARQTVFLTGEAGLGKTTVVNAFVEEAAGAGDVWLARGQCIEHYGAGEAYLPVLEALGRLCREPEGAALLPVLEQQAPTWLAQMPALLSPAALEAVQRRVVGATQQRMLRELAEAVEVLTVSRPLLLVLEDLHWSDYATLDLLTYLARRVGRPGCSFWAPIGPSRCCCVGIPCRPSSRNWCCTARGWSCPWSCSRLRKSRSIWRSGAPVGRISRPPIRRLAPLMLPAHGRSPALHGDDCRASAPLWRAPGGAGQWEVQPEAAAALQEVPPSVREMIEQQFERLSPRSNGCWKSPSVAGSACAVAAVAAGLDLAMEAVEDCCAGLAQRGQFLVASGMEAWPDGTVTERYDWQHALYQEVVYARVPEGRRLRLHRRIGTREETGYGEQARAHAAELAMHFERAQDTARAVQYLQQAAENAMQRYASQEAGDYLRRGLALLIALPETPERAQQELDLQLALGPALMATKGSAAPEVEQTYARARMLCARSARRPSSSRRCGAYGSFYFNRGALPAARELGEQLSRAGAACGGPSLPPRGPPALGMTSFFLGDYAAAHAHCAQGIDPHRPHGAAGPGAVPMTPPLG